MADELPSGDIPATPYKFGWVVGCPGFAPQTNLYYSERDVVLRRGHLEIRPC
jgi:hypothetical protein